MVDSLKSLPRHFHHADVSLTLSVHDAVMNPHRALTVSILAVLALASCGGSKASKVAKTTPSGAGAVVTTTQGPAIAVTVLGEQSRIAPGAGTDVSRALRPLSR